MLHLDVAAQEPLQNIATGHNFQDDGQVAPGAEDHHADDVVGVRKTGLNDHLALCVLSVLQHTT